MKRTKVAEPRIEDHLNLLRKIAWSYNSTTGIEYDELFSEACLAYCQNIKKYDHTKGAVSTFLYRSVSNSLNWFAKKYQRFIYFSDIVDESGILLYDSLDRESHTKQYPQKEIFKCGAIQMF